ncbi:MAG TPA: rhodanese-like domain-containing protein [Acetobacteraceae bacterium]|nr:rhodanese-like domain-containing protein [Acetobacteraceae bacterium]
MVENVSPAQVWEALKSDPHAQLVDVRTDAEWNFVGIPDLADAGKEPLLIPWQVYPTMQVNEQFTEHLKQAGLTPDQHLYFICRTGGRSTAAARAMQQAGFRHSYNVADGFEGLPDAAGHRGTVNGWKAEGLPWRQK